MDPSPCLTTESSGPYQSGGRSALHSGPHIIDNNRWIRHWRVGAHISGPSLQLNFSFLRTGGRSLPSGPTPQEPHPRSHAGGPGQPGPLAAPRHLDILPSPRPGRLPAPGALRGRTTGSQLTPDTASHRPPSPPLRAVDNQHQVRSPPVIEIQLPLPRLRLRISLSVEQLHLAAMQPVLYLELRDLGSARSS